MQRLRLNTRRLAWLALVAVLAMALVPTLARALAHGQGASTQWVEVCTAQGMKMVPVAAAQAQESQAPEASPLSQLEHCPMCALGHLCAGPPAALPAPLPAAAARLVPARFLHAPRTLHVWRASQPRGPPFLS